MSSYVPTKMQMINEFVDPPTTHSNERPASYLHYAYDNLLQTYIPFDTSSDAMIACLATAHNIPSEHVEIFLSLIQDSDFDGSEVTLRSTTDIYARIRQHRIREVICKSDHSTNNSVINNVVLCGVIEVLEEDIMHFESLKNKLYLDVNEARDYDLWAVRAKEAKQTLSLMSLVHPSWTEPSRHALGKSINMRCEVSFLENGAESEMERNGLRSPLYGPWTRNFSLRAVDYWSGQRWGYLFRMAHKLTNVRTVNLSFPIYNDEVTELAWVFLASLESMQELVIEDMSEGTNESILSMLLLRLSRLPMLEKIRLPRISEGLFDQPLPKDVVKAQSSHLLEIQFIPHVSSSNLNVTHIAWSRSDVDARFALSSLVLASRPPSRSPLDHVAKALEPSLHTLASLALETVSESDAMSVLRQCKSLRRLSIMSVDFPAAGILASIPRTLEHLSVVFTSETPIAEVEIEQDGNSNWDRQLAAVLTSKRTPLLQQLRISCIRLDHLLPEDEQGALEVQLPLTRLICEGRGVDLDEDLNWTWKGASFAEAEPED